TTTHYGAAAGTSFAAPVAAGAALLARRVYAERVNPGCHATCNPAAASPSLVKAMLVASAKSMKGGTSFSAVSSSTIIGALPNDQQGFGRIHLQDMLSTSLSHYYFN